MPSLRVIVTGRVQGVGYRYFAQRTATALGLGGFTRNLPDGGVEIAATGDKSLLESFLAKLSEGPSMSRVDNADFEWLDEEKHFDGFSIKY